MDNTTLAIWRKFRVKRGDAVPFTGWFGNRTTLAELFGELGFNRGAEIGVQRGLYSEILCQKNPNLKLLCIDPWEPYNKQNKDFQDAAYKEAVERLTPYGVEFIKKPSSEAAKDIADGSLDFAYIDAMHEFDNVMMDLILWSPKVKRGGIVAGHDYCNFYQAGVIAAVNAYTVQHNICWWYVTRDREPSFFWVKP